MAQNAAYVKIFVKITQCTIFTVENRSQINWVTSEIFSKLPIATDHPTVKKIAQSGHPASDLEKVNGQFRGNN
jgi:hypothetical protein